MNTIISFGLCPFVQRSLITLNHKNMPYEVKYIDLENKPDWFLKISPLGKVPVLQVNEKDVLFESAVINEYLDETNGESLHSSDPLVKAKERAYIELASVITFNYFHAATAKDKESFEKHQGDFSKNLNSLLDKFKGPYFRGEQFSLVDTATIPILQRLYLTKNLVSKLELSEENDKKLQIWSKATLNLQEVKHSVPENFDADFKAYIDKKESYITRG